MSGKRETIIYSRGNMTFCSGKKTSKDTQLEYGQ